MSFTEVLAELPTLTIGERQLVIQRALDLDETELAPGDEALVEERLANHHQKPESALPLAEVKARLRARFSQ